MRMTACAALVAALLTSHQGTAVRPAAVPVLVELFTAEGCSSCPPADALLEKLLEQQPAEGVVLVGLGEHVDYWDKEGWKDRFSSAQFTARQREYVSRGVGSEVFTPQIVVDGQGGFVGSDVGALRSAVERVRGEPHATLQLRVESDGAQAMTAFATLSDVPSGVGVDHIDVFVAITADHLRSDVKSGENKGRTLTHAAVVRELRPAGTGQSPVKTTIKIAKDWKRGDLHVVAFAQERTTKRVIATAAALP